MGSTLRPDPAGLSNLMGSSCVLGPVFDFTVPGVLPLGATFARASKATLFDSAGTLQEVANNVPAWTYNPSTLALQGLNDEELRTNANSNPRAEGSAGAAPTDWTVITQNGLTRTISRLTINGMPVLRSVITGTVVDLAAANVALFSPATSTIAAIGETWTNSFSWSVSGSIASALTATIGISQRNGAGANIAILTDPLGAPPSTLTRLSSTKTLDAVGTAFALGRIDMQFPIGATLNFTLDLSCPQFEKGNGASSIILPPVGAPAATTRAVAVVQLALANGTYNIDIYRASGLTSLTNVVVTGNSYTVPTGLSPLRLVIPKRIA